MRFLIILLAIFSSLPARADYLVDLTSVPTVPNTGGPVVVGYTGAGGGSRIYGTQSPVYDLSGLGIPDGALIDFGTLNLYWVGAWDQYGDVGFLAPSYQIGSGIPLLTSFYGCNIYFNPGCNPQRPPNVVIDLKAVYTPTLQFSYSPGTFIPAVPEPSTWAMLLIGFAGLSIGAYRRSSRLRLKVVH